MQPNFTVGSPSVPLPAAHPTLAWISSAESPLNAAHSVPQVSLQQKLLSGDAARGTNSNWPQRPSLIKMYVNLYSLAYLA